MKGYLRIEHCSESPEGTFEELLLEEVRAVQRSLALLQRTINKLVIEKRPRPSIERGYK